MRQTFRTVECCSLAVTDSQRFKSIILPFKTLRKLTLRTHCDPNCAADTPTQLHPLPQVVLSYTKARHLVIFIPPTQETFQIEPFLTLDVHQMESRFCSECGLSQGSLLGG